MRLPLSAGKATILSSLAAFLSSDTPHGLTAPVYWEDAKVAQTLACAHLESCYAKSLMSLNLAPHLLSTRFGLETMDKEAAIDALIDRLPAIVRSSFGLGAAHAVTVWGVGLLDDTATRRSLVGAFLRAREWDVDAADAFLRETIAWRHEEGIEAVDVRESVASELGFPDDAICTIDDGQPRTVVILAMGKVSLEGLRDVNAFVEWRIRMQERACRALAPHWPKAPHGPKYTLVLDCEGLRPYHFGRACRAALAQLTFVCTHYYPDFVGETVVINAPAFLRTSWRVVGPLMPSWWGVRLGRLSDLGLSAA